MSLSPVLDSWKKAPLCSLVPKPYMQSYLSHGFPFDDYLEALAEVESIRLLTKKELQFLFPSGGLHCEKFFGLNKSWTVFGEWPLDPSSSFNSPQAMSIGKA